MQASERSQVRFLRFQDTDGEWVAIKLGEIISIVENVTEGTILTLFNGQSYKIAATLADLAAYFAAKNIFFQVFDYP